MNNFKFKMINHFSPPDIFKYVFMSTLWYNQFNTLTFEYSANIQHMIYSNIGCSRNKGTCIVASGDLYFTKTSNIILITFYSLDIYNGYKNSYTSNTNLLSTSNGVFYINFNEILFECFY